MALSFVDEVAPSFLDAKERDRAEATRGSGEFRENLDLRSFLSSLFRFPLTWPLGALAPVEAGGFRCCWGGWDHAGWTYSAAFLLLFALGTAGVSPPLVKGDADFTALFGFANGLLARAVDLGACVPLGLPNGLFFGFEFCSWSNREEACWAGPVVAAVAKGFGVPGLDRKGLPDTAPLGSPSLANGLGCCEDPVPNAIIVEIASVVLKYPYTFASSSPDITSLSVLASRPASGFIPVYRSLRSKAGICSIEGGFHGAED